MIKQFQGKYRWLSNFAPCDIVLNGRIYKSVEHAYMSAKSDDLKWKLFCQKTEKPGEVKKASKKINLVYNWHSIKMDIMKKCLEQKYKQEPYKTLLKNTADESIQEGNKWHDLFWGVDLETGKGENNLGKLIMEIRKNILPDA